jgi:metal-sulfur cluster biosynthetic enzyme
MDLLQNTNRGGIMARNISEQDIHQAIGQVMHPEINRTLVELGMVKDITLKDNEVTLTLVLPFLGIPVLVKDYLMNSLCQAVMKVGAKVEIKVAEMNPEERLAFLAMEKESWNG